MLTAANVLSILATFGIADVAVSDARPAGRWQLLTGEQRMLATGGIAWTGRLVRDDGVEVTVANDGRGSINTYTPDLAAQVLEADARAVFPDARNPVALLLMVAEVYTTALRQAVRASRRDAA